MAPKIDPTFSERKELVRYISDANRLSGNRASVAAFYHDDSNEDPANEHFSVNSLEIETLNQIADYHRWKWQSSTEKVALCIHRVHEYNDAAKKSNVRIRKATKWEFTAGGGVWEDAYRSRPVYPYGEPPHGSPSHCGVEFVRAIKNPYEMGKFARRMT